MFAVLLLSAMVHGDDRDGETDRDVGCCMATDWSQPEAKACNRADTAVFCNTEMVGCEWLLDAEHKLQVDCDEPDPGHLIVRVRHSMTHLLDTEVSLLGVAVFITVCFAIKSLYRCWAARMKKKADREAQRLEMARNSLRASGLYYQTA